MATELPYQTYERLTGKTWTGGTTQPILDAYKKYGITDAAGSAAANTALQTALLKGGSSTSSSTADTTAPTVPVSTGVTVPDASAGTNPVVSATGTRSGVDSLGQTIKDMQDTTGITSAHNDTVQALNDRMTALDQQRAAEIARITSDFNEAQSQQETRQGKDYAGTSTNLVTAGGGFLGFTGSHSGVLQNLKQTFDQEKQALLSKREAAIQQAKSAYDDKQFAVAASLTKEAKDYQDELYNKQKDYANNQLALAQEARTSSEYARTAVEKDLSAYTDLAATSDNVTLDPTKVKQIDDFYGVPGYTKAAVKIAQATAKAKTDKEKLTTDIDIQTLLSKIPSGQKVTLGGQTYVGTKKAAAPSTSGVISPLIIQQIPQLAPLAGQKEDDIILSLELSKPPTWFTQTLQAQSPNAPVDPQAAWDSFRNEPDLTAYRNTVRLNKRASIANGLSPEDIKAAAAAFGLDDQ